MKTSEYRTSTARVLSPENAREYHQTTDKYLFVEGLIPGDVADQIADENGTIPAWYVIDLENRLSEV